MLNSLNAIERLWSVYGGSREMSGLIIKRIDFDPEFEPLFLSPLIKHEFLKDLDKSEALVQRTRKETARLRKKAKELLVLAEKEREEERQKGLEEGRQEGLAQLTEQLIEVENLREKILKEAEPDMIRMVMDIAEKVISREVAAGAIVDIVKQTLSRVPGKKVIVRVNPEDGKVLKKKEAELLTGLEGTQSLSVKEDETISRGGCIIESELGMVDACLETQIAAIKKAMGLIS